MYGFLCGLAMSGWIMIEFLLGFHSTSFEIGRYSGYFSVIIPVVFIFVALRERQSQSKGILAVKEGWNRIPYRNNFKYYYYNFSLFLQQLSQSGLDWTNARMATKGSYFERCKWWWHWIIYVTKSVSERCNNAKHHCTCQFHWDKSWDNISRACNH